MNLPGKQPGFYSRRQFIGNSAALVSAAVLPGALRLPSTAAEQKTYRAAIIGHTGAGNYGHGLDMIFSGRPNIEVVALADPDADGRAKAATRTGAARQYADYREMLAKEKPDLVSVAPRWTLQHHAMGLAVLQAGAHLFMEKPLTHTLAEADELLSVAEKAQRKVAVAHQMRLSPSILFLKQQVDAGLIGKLLEVRAHGKQDHRAGGEDLLVLGVHLFDLMRFFAGDAHWCTARVLQNERPVTRQDARPATEGIGLVLGDELSAQFAFARGVNATFTSRRANQQAAGHWGLALIGSQGAARILADVCPRIFARAHGNWQTSEWKPVEGDPTSNWSDVERSVQHANDRVVDHWLDAIQSNREPVCSGIAGMKAVEMAHAVFTAGLSGGRVTLPLKSREHPLAWR
jgi:predicted dehydrogenase